MAVSVVRGQHESGSPSFSITAEPTDNRLLYPMARATKEAVEADTLTVVADAGYSNGADAAACERDGITPCVPQTGP